MTPAEKKEVRRVVVGLLKIAELVMPDTFFASDSRLKRARKLLAALKERK